MPDGRPFEEYEYDEYGGDVDGDGGVDVDVDGVDVDGVDVDESDVDDCDGDDGDGEKEVEDDAQAYR